jgi:hypothetical protein
MVGLSIVVIRWVMVRILPAGGRIEIPVGRDVSRPCNFQPFGILSARPKGIEQRDGKPGKMRAEIESIAAEIKQSIELLRRHL